jgi:archaellum component FlaG (FlaF/FlaG flagellin family)
MNVKRRLLKNRKAMSTVVSSLLILSIVTVLCITTYNWALFTVGEANVNFNSIYEYSQNTIKERFILENVFFTDTDSNPGDHKNITIYVRNVGDTTITISYVDLNGTTSAVDPSLPQTLPCSI